MAKTTEEKLAELRKNLKENPRGKTTLPESPLKHEKFNPFKTTAGVMRLAIESNPEHPVALAFQKGVGTFPDTQELVVDRVDMEALLDNKVVERESIQEEQGGELVSVTQKVLGGPWKKEEEKSRAPVAVSSTFDHTAPSPSGSPLTMHSTEDLARVGEKSSPSGTNPPSSPPPTGEVAAKPKNP